MKGFGTKEITDEIVELDDLAKKKFLFPSLRFGLGAHVSWAHRKQKKMFVFSGQKNIARKKGAFILFRREKKKKHFGKQSRHRFFVVFWMIELPVWMLQEWVTWWVCKSWVNCFLCVYVEIC